MSCYYTSMKVAFLLLFVGIVLGFPESQQLADEAPPTWKSVFSVKGVLNLPYAEIEEPFSAYYDAANKRSRIDYYGGMQITIQRADKGQYGESYKVAPITTNTVNNQMTCFLVPGFSEAKVDVQSVLPDLTGFTKQANQDIVDGQSCDVWRMVDVEGKKKNTYTMWVSANGDPVRYEMMGFDSLLGSHFDKYVLDYYQYMTSDIPEKMFEPPTNLTCGDFPGPGLSTHQHRILNNPMQEFINKYDHHTVEMFEQFKSTHKPNYDGEKEHQQRLHNFRNNIRFIHSKNRQGLSYNLAVNHLADKSVYELKMRNGYRHTQGDHGAQVYDKSTVNRNAVPDSKDWRLYGAVTPVKDQGVCGSCWSFGTVGTIEGAYFLKTGTRVRLSQQELVDCSWQFGNNGCDGGEDFRSYQWIMQNKGITSEAQYGQYLAVDGFCHSDKVKPVAVIDKYVNITSMDQEALKFAISEEGPVSVAIDASHRSLSFYADGVYYEPKCGNKPDQLDHAVLAVGYGTMQGQAYWLIKNSWSTYWGNDGYVLMSQKDNNCGVATAPTFVKLK